MPFYNLDSSLFNQTMKGMDKNMLSVMNFARISDGIADNIFNLMYKNYNNLISKSLENWKNIFNCKTWDDITAVYSKYAKIHSYDTIGELFKIKK